MSNRGHPKSPGYKPGQHWAKCDVCDCDFLIKDLKRRWDNVLVCKDHWEPRHEQDFADQGQVTMPTGKTYGGSNFGNGDNDFPEPLELDGSEYTALTIVVNDLSSLSNQAIIEGFSTDKWTLTGGMGPYDIVISATGGDSNLLLSTDDITYAVATNYTLTNVEADQVLYGDSQDTNTDNYIVTVTVTDSLGREASDSGTWSYPGA